MKQGTKDKIMQAIDTVLPELAEISKTLYENPEIGGTFEEADFAMMVHPTPDQTAVGGRTLAIESIEIDFIGKSAHAGVEPEKGINALDAACAFYQMVNIQKQYYPDTNVHGVILETGKKASVISDFTSLHFLNRAWDMTTIHKLKKMMTDCAEADVSFRDMKGSTDMGDVSQTMPCIHPWLHLPCANGVLHSQEFADATQEPHAEEYLSRSAKAMALTAGDILCDPQLLKEIKQEFQNSDPMPFNQ